MKNFKEELLVLFNRLKSREPFSFSKFADGEWLMIRGIPIDRKSTRLNSSHTDISRMPSSA